MVVEWAEAALALSNPKAKQKSSGDRMQQTTAVESLERVSGWRSLAL
jgi:hypothetical protein